MKTFITTLLFVIATFSASAQCAQNNTFALDATPPCPGTQTITNVSGGTYYTVNVVAGNTYTFSTCGVAAFDTQITVLNGAVVLGYNDDGCGAQSTVTWVATFTGTIQVLVDNWPCLNTGTGAQLVVQCSLPVQTGNGCNTNTTICTQGIAGPFGFSTPGNPVGSCLDWIGLTYAYIVLYITQSGPLEMLIDGNAATGFLDVAIFDIPAGDDPCVAIENPANEISCNYASASSGCNQIGSYYPCPSTVPSPMVTAGDVLMIVVENWSNASTTFTMDLSPPPGAQTGPPDPAITPVGPFCDTDGPIQLNAVDNGGVWVGPGTTADGLFNPSAVGPGTYTIDYSVGSGPCLAQSSTSITVNDCSSPCYFDWLSTNTGACETGSVFEVSGDFSFVNNPGSGTIVVEVTNASGTWTQTFNAPFVDGQLYNYSIYADADGSAGTVTIYFTADPACVVTQAITSPPSCDCPAEIGTFTVTTTAPVSGNNITLCFGDAVDITTNGDWVAPGEAFAPPGPVYDPGVTWLVYTCPPSVALVPDPMNAIPDDPCILGVVSDFDLNEMNDQWWINAFPGQFTDNIVYFVPITMYSIATGTYSYVNTTMPCYELGTPYAIQYLPEVIATPTENCVAGTVSVVVSGGQPAIDGSNFTGQNLLPATATFTTGTTGNGGTIVVGGLVDGDAYSFDIVDANGCPITITGTFVGLEDPSFTYPSIAYCENLPNPSPTITGVPGGTFTASPGVVINASTGVINLMASTPGGPYTITYTTPDAVCFDQATFNITINPQPVVDGNDPVVCAGGQVTLNGTGANTYVWTGGVTNGVAFTPAGTATYTVTGTITATGCSNTGTATVTVNPLDNATFTTTSFCAGTASPAATVTGTPGGTFSYNPNPADGSTVNAATGSITGGVGGTTYTLQYTTSGACPATSTQPVTVYALPVVDVPDYSVCTGGTITLTATGANTYAWSPGTYLSATAGATVNYTAGLNTVYTVTGTNANGCIDTDVTSVTVIPNAPINAGVDVTICAGDVTTLTATGGVTYNWQAPISAAGAVQNVSPATTTTYTVNGQDAAGCLGTDQVTVNVNPLPTATISGTTAVCVGAAAPTVTFTGANGTSPYTFTYNINGGANQTIVSVGTTATISAPTGVAGTFVYNLVSVAGANLCDQPQVGSATITVNPLPTAVISGTINVCEDDASPTITFTGANGTAPYTFTYNINGGANLIIVSVGNTATISVPTGTPGTFNYNLISVQDASATACSQAQVGTATIVVNPMPTATISGTIDVCIGGAAVITFTGANGTAPYTFTYNINGGANQTIVSVGNTATINAPTGTAGVFDYNLISVVDASSTVCGQPQIGTATVTVNPSPTATIAGTVDVCVGDAAPTITFTGSNGTPNYTFTYTINGGANQTLVSAGTTGTVTQSTATAGTYIYDLISVEDASSTACAQGAALAVTIVVNPLPTVTISGTTSVCENAASPSVTFTGANGTAPYTFTYNINGGANQTIVSVGNTATIVVPTTPTGTYNYNLVSVEDASTTTCAQAQVGTATITVNPNPLPVINGATDYCAGTFATLSTSLPYSTYLWSTGDVTPTSNVTIADNNITVFVTNAFGCSATSPAFIVAENSVITYNTTVTICQGDVAVIHGNNETVAGVYSQTFILGTGCDSTSNVTLVVNPLPIINAGIDQALCATDPVTLNATGAPAIVWNVVGVTNGVPFTQPVGTVTYTATGTDVNGCVNTDQVNVLINPLPTATIAGTIAVCQNAAAPTITFTGANATAPYTFTYNINGGASLTVVSVGNVATLTAPTGVVGSFTYNLLSVEDASATSCSQVQVGSATVTVNPLPTAAVSGSTAVCLGDVAPTITFTGASGTAPYTFTYNINGGANQTVTSVGNTATLSAPTGVAGTFNYNLISVVDASSTACTQAQVGIATVVVNPLPTATIAGTTAVCIGAASPTITFTGANGTAPYTFTYNINGGANQTIVSVGTTATIAAPTGVAGVFNYNLVSVEDASSTSCSQAQVGTATITVNPAPTATLAGTIDVCEGDAAPTITFTGANGTANYTFTYNINGGASQNLVSTGNTATITAPTGSPGVYTYNLTNVQDASVTACSQTQFDVITVTVNALPTATIAGTTTVCVDDANPTITFTGANGTAPYTFTYNINGGANQTVVSVVNTATVSASTSVAGTFNYNLVSVEDASSTTCSQAQVGIATVTVNPLPTATISGTTEVCLGDPNPTITLTGANGTAPYTFTYNINGGAPQTIVSVGNTATISVPTAIAGTFAFNLVSVEDASATGCSQAQVGTATITVNALPIVFAGNDFLICEGNQAILTASGANTYVWNVAGVTNGVAFTPSNTATYTVTGTDVNGCVNTDQVTVTVEPLPIVSFTADVTSGCAPLAVTFTNTTPGSLTNCIWTLSNGTTMNGCGSVSTVFPNGGLYDVTLTTTSANGCTNSATYIDYIYVEDLPIASFTPSSSVVSVFNTEILFDNNSSGAVNYLWDFGDNSGNSTQENPLHTFPDEGQGAFTVELIAYSALGCTDTAYVTIIVNEELIFYVPNTFTPDGDDFNEYFQAIFTSGYDPYDFNLLIFNRWGELIWESHNDKVGWNGTYGEDKTKLVQDGTYTWKIDFKTTMTDERIMVVGHVNVIR